MSKVLDELILWSLNRTDSPENFVVLGITDCDGGSACTKATRNELERHNITFLSDCNVVQPDCSVSNEPITDWAYPCDWLMLERTLRSKSYLYWFL